jgi:hypothetical protein
MMGDLTATEVGLTTSLCSVGSLIATKVGLTVDLYSTLDMLINGHKWILLVRSMDVVRGHAYKRHREFLE